METLVSIGFCMGIFAIVAAAFSLTRMKHRLTEHRHAENAAIELAKHDALTGLPNRRKLDDSFNDLMDQVQPDECRAVLMLDVDGFKPVNDLYGHGVGDILLCKFAERLTLEVGSEGLVARLGGDEFAIVSPVLSEKPDAGSLARRLLAAIQKPFDIEGREIRIGSGVGISLFPDDGHSSSELLRRADIALYRAKTSGTSLFRFFEIEMDASILHRSLLEQRLRRAMDSDALKPEYQPIIRLSDNKIIGFEALARWYDPDFGYVPPNQFIPIAEDAGMISELTENILRQACKAASRWPDDIDLSLNISSLKLQEQGFPLKLAAVLAESGVLPQRITLDISEAALSRNVKLSHPVLRQLADSGIKLALDDYGVGNSSLNILRQLPIDTVKIDDNFVCGVLKDPECAAMVEAVLVLTKGLNLRVVAEGLEQKEIVDWLSDRQCEAGQGHYFGTSLTAEAATKLVQAGGWIAPAGSAAEMKQLTENAS
ncbi:putative bifunctional diguanylate cyclase/phosphodiesterase [Roseibium limicola]